MTRTPKQVLESILSELERRRAVAWAAIELASDSEDWDKRDQSACEADALSDAIALIRTEAAEILEDKP